MENFINDCIFVGSFHDPVSNFSPLVRRRQLWVGGHSSESYQSGYRDRTPIGGVFLIHLAKQKLAIKPLSPRTAGGSIERCRHVIRLIKRCDHVVRWINGKTATYGGEYLEAFTAKRITRSVDYINVSKPLQNIWYRSYWYETVHKWRSRCARLFTIL